MSTRKTRKSRTPDRPTPPRRPRNLDVRTREYLTEDEITRLVEAAAGTGRHGLRDATMILLGFRHGLRCSEVISLRWDQVDLDKKMLHVRRSKGGTPSTHPLTRTELAWLRKLAGNEPRNGHVFTTERNGPVSESGFFKIVARSGREAGFDLPIHPHMLRHSCGFKLANEGRDTRTIQDYLGHANIQHTVRYTKLAPGRFEGLFKD